MGKSLIFMKLTLNECRCLMADLCDMCDANVHCIRFGCAMDCKHVVVLAVVVAWGTVFYLLIAF